MKALISVLCVLAFIVVIVVAAIKEYLALNRIDQKDIRDSLWILVGMALILGIVWGLT